MVRSQGDDPLLMIPKKYISILFISVMILTMLVLVRSPIPTHDDAQLIITPSKAFSLSTTPTYTNKTMHFQVGDPYEGYSYWTYEVVGDTQGPSDNEYYVGTDTNGDAEYFGFDEFVAHSVVSAQVDFRTSAITGTYHFQPLGYFYQKTNLESNTRWALAIDWDSTGIDLYYNTGNGDAPTSVNLVGTAPSVGVNYKITLSNLGDQTFVEIQDISTFPTYPILYSGYTTTESYNATSLYAGFGQYCSGDGSIIGVWDDLRITDTTYTYPASGTGFSRIDAYVDTVFTQRIFDIDTGSDLILDISATATNITLIVDCWLNSTTVNVATLAEGRNVIRQNVTVTHTNGTVVFSQDNLTYVSAIDYGDNVFLYRYSVQLSFTLDYSTIYAVELIYEIYYSVVP